MSAAAPPSVRSPAMAPTHLVTISAPQRRVDLVLPGGVPMRELVPDIVLACVDYNYRDPGARWAITPMGGQPLDPDTTLDQAGVLDGAVLYLRDMARPVTPVQVPAPKSGANVTWQQPYAAPRATAASHNTQRHGPTRWGLEPMGPTVATVGALDVLLAVWLLINVSAKSSAFLGCATAVLTVGIFLAVIWWLGWAEWFAEVTHISAFGRLRRPPGLKPGPSQ